MSGEGSDGFADESIRFLRALEANNTRDWFDANREVYQRAIKRPADAFGAAVAERLSALTGKPNQAKIFRIHRDVRFSKDKTPYNAHLHIAFHRVGGSPQGPSWFFGLHPDRLMLGAGVMAFDKMALEAYRARAAGDDGAILSARLAALADDGVRISNPELKRIPAGFVPDHPRGDLLRHKGLAAWIDAPDPAPATRPGAVEACIEGFIRLKPLHDWLAGTGH